MSRQKKFAERITRIGVFKRMAYRFVAGEGIDQAIEVANVLNKNNIKVTFDHLGENVSNEEQAKQAADEYIVILEEIKKNNCSANVSLKLTQMGMDIGHSFCLNNVERIVKKAKELNNFVRIDMESSNYTDLTLDIFKQLKQRYDNVGIVIQAYLFRSSKDIDEIIKIKGRVRLCKGAYMEPSTIAFKKKRDTDANFIELMKKLLMDSEYHAIATHDEKMIQATINFAKEKGIPKDKFEFQMLYGIRRERQLELANDGYNVRIYVPYGKEWYPYFMRRLGERPANLFFILRYL
jgi:proline dehydrogenase